MSASAPGGPTPLHAPSNPDTFGTPAEQARRAVVLCRAYGHTPDTRLLDAVVERVQWLIGHIREQAEQGSAAFLSHIADGHVEPYEADIGYITAHRETLSHAFGEE